MSARAGVSPETVGGSEAAVGRNWFLVAFHTEGFGSLLAVGWKPLSIPCCVDISGHGPWVPLEPANGAGGSAGRSFSLFFF